MSIDSKLQSIWYRGARGPWFPALVLLSWLFAASSALRRLAYRVRVFSAASVARPVIVVGNITVGGTGKTPLVAWLAIRLAARGVRVGIITRGYGGSSKTWPRVVDAHSDPLEVGDESVLLAQRTGALVVAGPDRVASATRAVASGVDIVLSDDGLQHYRLRRQCEIAVLDAARGVGNGRLLPAGPLRESIERLRAVDIVVTANKSRVNDVATSAASVANRIVVSLTPKDAVHMTDETRRALTDFAGSRVHAVAAIGNPESFFGSLEDAGAIVERHAFADHFPLTQADINFTDDAPILMTEKDAVKCHPFAGPRCWYVPLEVEISATDEAQLWSVLDARLAGRPTDIAR